MLGFILSYIDPGSSSMLIQMLVAGVLGALFFIKNSWYRIKSFFFKSKDKDADTPTTD